MKSLYSLSNQVSGLTTKTVQAFTHAYGIGMVGIRQWNIAAVPAISGIRNPTSFSAGRSYPDHRVTLVMNDFQRPFSFKVQHVMVGNEFGSNRINNLNLSFLQHQLWSNPNQVSDCSQNYTKKKFPEELHAAGTSKVTICRKQQNQSKRRTGPNEIASGSKSVGHGSIITGDTK